MSDSEQQPSAGAVPAQELPIVVHTQYVKDLSFENPNAPAILRNIKSPPKLDVKLDVGARPLQPRIFEVILRIEVGASVEEEKAFVVELEYGGLASIAPDVPPAEVEALLLVDGARMIFPFARRVLADSTRDGGFPPVLVSPIDFAQLYERRKEQAAAEAASKEAAAAGEVAPPS